MEEEEEEEDDDDYAYEHSGAPAPLPKRRALVICIGFSPLPPLVGTDHRMLIAICNTGYIFT